MNWDMKHIKSIINVIIVIHQGYTHVYMPAPKHLNPPTSMHAIVNTDL